MQTEPQQDNKLVTLATNAQLQGQQMSQQIADARRLLYDAYAQVASGEGSLATLQETLFAFDTQIELIQRTGEINTEIVKMQSEAIQALTAQRDQLADQLDTIQEDFEEAVIDTASNMSSFNELQTLESLAEEIAFGAGFDSVAADKSDETEALLDRAAAMAESLTSGLDYDYDDEPEDDYQPEFEDEEVEE